MKTVLTFLKWFGIGLLVIILALLVFLRVRYGGGKEYDDISTKAIYSSNQLEVYFSYPEPIGNVAATNDTTREVRVFFTIHPESRPEINQLMEIVDGAAITYPTAEVQSQLFTSVLGVYCDQQNRLWTIDHGNHGSAPVKLTAFDLNSDRIVHEYVFPREVAEYFSFFNDLTVTPNGRYIFVADVSFFGKKPSLVVYDVVTGRSRSLLDGHESVEDEGYVPVAPAKKMRFLGGLIDLLTGIDGLDVSPDGSYIYYAAMGNSGLFRIPVSVCTDFSKTSVEVSAAVERVGDKPLSDGIRTDALGNVYITDIEHRGIYVIEPSGKGYTLIKDERIRWADGLSLAADGYFYLADSAIPEQMLRSKENMEKQAPYYIFRFRPKGYESLD